MKKLSASALLFGLAAAPLSADTGFSLTADPFWALDIGTHLYDDLNGTQSVSKSLELGLTRGARALVTDLGTFTCEIGFSTTILGADIKDSDSTDSLTGKLYYRTRLFGQIGFETHGRYFFKPMIGFEEVRAKTTHYRNTGSADTGALKFQVNGTTSIAHNVYGGLGFGYRFANGGKAMVSINTLGDDDERDDFRVTYTTGLGH